eukprot:s3160_g5.t1
MGQSEAQICVSGCTHGNVGPIVRGDYNIAGSNHNKPAYKKEQKVSGLDVMLYYWDERDGMAFSGWWFGPKIGGDQVWAYQPTRTTETPPQSGWKVPYDGPVDLSLCAGSTSAAAMQAAVRQLDAQARSQQIAEMKKAAEDQKRKLEEARVKAEENRKKLEEANKKRIEDEKRRLEESKKKAEEQKSAFAIRQAFQKGKFGPTNADLQFWSLGSVRCIDFNLHLFPLMFSSRLYRHDTTTDHRITTHFVVCEAARASPWEAAVMLRRCWLLCLHLVPAKTQENPGCCFTIGYGSQMVPCCLTTQDLGMEECYSAETRDVGVLVVQAQKGQGIGGSRAAHALGAERGWRQRCPVDAEEANTFILDDQDERESQALGASMHHKAEKALPWWAWIFIIGALGLAIIVGVAQVACLGPGDRAAAFRKKCEFNGDLMAI